MSLFNESGHASQNDRNQEALRYVEELSADSYIETLTPRERIFVKHMKDDSDNGRFFCSTKQLFWLRDLYNKYILEI